MSYTPPLLIRLEDKLLSMKIEKSSLLLLRAVYGLLDHLTSEHVCDALASLMKRSSLFRIVSTLLAVYHHPSDSALSEEVATLGLRAINNFASRGHQQKVQGILTSTELQFEFQKLMRSLFASCKSGDSTALLSQLLVLIGHYTYGNDRARESLNWGHPPTPLQSLCDVPFYYFSSLEGKKVLFPSIACVCYENVTNLAICAREFSPSLISDYLVLDDLSRIPREAWDDAKKFFNKYALK